MQSPDDRSVIRTARRNDVPAIVRLLQEDEVGAGRESAGDDGPYLSAFDAIAADPAHLLLVADLDGEVVGTLQLTFIPGLARRGTLRAQIEAVMVGASHCGTGVGGLLMRHAINEASLKGCGLVQLTSDRRRARAHQFYERLGFVITHHGMKLIL